MATVTLVAARQVSLIPAQEIRATQDKLKELQNYQNNNWAIGLNGDTFQPDGFLGFFSQRGLSFKYYINNQGVSVGSPSAYGENITTLERYIANIRAEEQASVESTIKELEYYKSNFWAIGLNGDTLQPDGFNNFFAARELTFKPFVRSKVSIGQESAYDENIATLRNYLKSIG
ncbi:hypothetical protein Cylst_5906 [Cylindrospermum stagnale PCC 7417]|uniref:Uncharacterized protein n=1 Tax=Cylindrospermum stagnale PCC 7417 TaxID=56107 RepID=K9X5W1_9NOST|nr:hypothetical protein [Cylindrospermum stagnale]AFZ27883.1 hypothetical protein Cylst_5906 [Cylindrospermum stagnale PCC 7417]